MQLQTTTAAARRPGPLRLLFSNVDEVLKEPEPELTYERADILLHREQVGKLLGRLVAAYMNAKSPPGLGGDRLELGREHGVSFSFDN